MNYQCLILDHDDTVFDSGHSVHYQAFLKSLDHIKPHLPKPSFLDFTRANFHLGFMRMCADIYGFSSDDFQLEYQIWKDFTKNTPSQAFEGFKPLLTEFKAQGGKIAVVSFSERDEIIRDYNQAFQFVPDLIFAHDTHRHDLKPKPFAVHHCLTHFNLSKEAVLVVDDNPSGYQMALQANVAGYYATWAHQDERIIDMIRFQNSPFLQSVEQLHHLLFK